MQMVLAPPPLFLNRMDFLLTPQKISLLAIIGITVSARFLHRAWLLRSWAAGLLAGLTALVWLLN